MDRGGVDGNGVQEATYFWAVDAFWESIGLSQVMFTTLLPFDSQKGSGHGESAYQSLRGCCSISKSSVVVLL